MFGRLGEKRTRFPARRRLAIEPLERRDLLAGVWHHEVMPADVTGDELVTPADALEVINDINARGARDLPSDPPSAPPPPYLDTTADDRVDASDVLLVVNELNRAAAPPPQSAVQSHFDFGTLNSPVASGYVGVNEASTYTPSRTYGWQSGAIHGIDRGAGESLGRDFNATANGTFVVDVPNGVYRVDVILGDRGSSSHGLVGIYLEGDFVDTVSTASGQLVAKSFQVAVSDGQLTLQFLDPAGTDDEACLEALRIVTAGSVRPAASSAWWPMFPEIPGAWFSAPVRDGNGFDVYTVDSEYQRSATKIRVLLPNAYASDSSYQTVYVLPVEANEGTKYGDGLVTVRNLNEHNLHPAIYVAPTFSDIPWYCDHSSDPEIRQETYFRTVVVPFIELRYPAEAERDSRLLLGFSKSGWGAFTMLLRFPDTFGRALAWDSPMGMNSSHDLGGNGFSSVVGSDANFQNYYVKGLVQSRGQALKDQPPRLFLYGYYFDFTRQGHAELHNLMAALGIPHVYVPGTKLSHVWHSGWVDYAVQLLFS